ncbi:hypothetical protein CCHR01_03505 [Colletotrichum chrysophilum]|uniref:Uncharacterized protein n=1 Tax=Colletotrichum chrysophilum TaxID=1836956 RepID=A0AAD9AV55_9PEZI|nr:hypothetical protein CCHR01_03505 [Colletotrichum chrysophilum]
MSTSLFVIFTLLQLSSGCDLLDGRKDYANRTYGQTCVEAAGDDKESLAVCLLQRNSIDKILDCGVRDDKSNHASGMLDAKEILETVAGTSKCEESCELSSVLQRCPQTGREAFLGCLCCNLMKPEQVQCLHRCMSEYPRVFINSESSREPKPLFTCEGKCSYLSQPKELRRGVEHSEDSPQCSFTVIDGHPHSNDGLNCPLPSREELKDGLILGRALGGLRRPGRPDIDTPHNPGRPYDGQRGGGQRGGGQRTDRSRDFHATSIQGASQTRSAAEATSSSESGEDPEVDDGSEPTKSAEQSFQAFTRTTKSTATTTLATTPNGVPTSTTTSLSNSAAMKIGSWSATVLILVLIQLTR